MSNIYVSEPPTKGKVVLHTTYGPLDIELWPKEAPKAVRNFVQLCLEGYYDDTIFHRIIKGFMVQGGDPTGTGTGGESIYGKTFGDEFHSRLRFKYRGLVACANAGVPNTNGSQFFISLDRCDWLDKKNTIFGKVTGDSVYNLLRLGEVETEKDDRPVDPAPKLKSVEVLWNPFDDIIPRVVAKSMHAASDTNNKEPKKKPVKKLNLLSFGEEAEEDGNELAVVKQKIKSSHDVLDDPRLLKEDIQSKEFDPSEVKAKKELQLSVREALGSKKDESKPKERPLTDVAESVDHSDDDEAHFDSRMRQQILMKRKELGDAPAKKKSSQGTASSKVREASPHRSDAELDDRPKKDKLYLKKKGIGSDARAERMEKADSDVQLLNESERARFLQKQKKRRIKGREEDVLAKLEKFKQSLTGEADGEKKVLDLREVKLQFTPESGKDNMSRSNDPNEYTFVDPLLEKGKEKFNKMQAKEKRKQREWAGRSLT